jgi:hypothetical protein
MSDFVTLSETRPRARKAHTCDWCSRTIDPGETYRRTGQIFDGRKYAWKGCQHCEAFVSTCDLYEWAGDFGLGPDDIDQYEPGDIFGARCLVMWRRKWRRKDGTLYPVPAKAVCDA